MLWMVSLSVQNFRNLFYKKKKLQFFFLFFSEMTVEIISCIYSGCVVGRV